MKKSVYDYKYRLTLEYEHYQLLKKYILNATISEEDTIMFNEIKEKIENPIKIEWSAKKLIAADKATAVRTEKAKKKIENAMNILRMENKKLTYYSIAKKAQVSYITVKKYITLEEI